MIIISIIIIGNPEKIQQNIDEIIQLTSSHEVKPPPNFEGV
jgi:hypothetical protein